MAFMLGLTIGLVVGWTILPRPQWVVDQIDKLKH